MSTQTFQTLRLLAYTAAVALNGSCAFAQMKFADALARIEDNRSRLLSYVASYQQITYGSETTTTEDSKSYSVLQVRRASSIADLTAGFSVSLVWKSPLSFKYPRQQVNLLFLKQKQKFFMMQGSRLAEVPATNTERFLNPEIVGFGFCTELRRYVDFPTIVGDFRGQSMRKPGERLDGDLIAFTSGNAKIILDESKACLPVSIDVSIGKNQGFSIKSKYEDHDGVWLPSSSHYDCGSTSHRFDIEWHSINQPVPPEVFDQVFIKQITGLQPSPTALEVGDGRGDK